MTLEPTCCIQSVPGKGRALFASRPVAAGDTLLIEAPALLVVPLACATSVCATCTRSHFSEVRIMCVSCGQAVFCSPQCEAAGRADPGIHPPAVCAAYCSIARGVASGLLPQDEDALDTCKFLAHALSLREAAQTLNDDSDTCKR